MATYTIRLSLRIIMAAAFLFTVGIGDSSSLEFPRFSSIFRQPGKESLQAVSEKASDEIREEDRVSEVLNQNADYRDLFKTLNNPDIQLRQYVTPGEELKYQAKWRGLPAGSIHLSAKRLVKLKNRPVFVFELNVESNDFLSAFYPVSTSINSYVDALNGRSYLIRRRVSERSRDYKDRLEFKYDFRLPNGLPDPVSKYSMVGENGQEVASQPFPIPGNMQDMISIIYYIRGMNLQKVGDSCQLLIGGRKKPVITSVSVIGEENINVPGFGNFDCLIVEPITDGTNLSGNLVATRGGERVWLEKNTLIPVMVTAELPKPLGTVAATLVHAENSELLKHVKNP